MEPDAAIPPVDSETARQKRQNENLLEETDQTLNDLNEVAKKQRPLHRSKKAALIPEPAAATLRFEEDAGINVA